MVINTPMYDDIEVAIAEPGSLAINMHSPSRTVVRIHDQATVTGDILQLWNDPGWRYEATANKRLYLAGEAVVDGNVSYSGFMRMEHQALITGDLRTTEGNMNLDMRNGVVEGVLQLAGAGQEHIFNMSGGAILGGFRGNAAYVNMLMTGGYIGGGLRTGDIFNAHIDGGSIDGGIAINTYPPGSASLRVITGQFDAVAGDYLLSMTRLPVAGSVLTSQLDIRGGEWGYNEQGLGFFLDGLVNFDIRGSGWSYANGRLSGYLMDGSWFNNRLTFGSNYQGIFAIHDIYANVPEPGTVFG